MAPSHAHDTETAGNTPAVAAMRHAKETIGQAMEGDLPAGAVADMLDVVCALWDLMDQAKLPALLRLAQIHASGNLAEVGGQATLAKWITHALRVPQSEAYGLALLAQLLYANTLPATRAALEREILSLGEAATIAKAIEQATKTRDKKKFADEDRFRKIMDAGIMAEKKKNPTLSCNELLRTGREVAVRLNPALVQDQHKKAFDARRADLARNSEGSHYFQAQGPDADAELIEAAFSAYTQPHDANKPHVSKAERTYDAFMAIIKTALEHQRCAHAPGPLAMINLTVPLDVYTGQRQARQAQETAREAGTTAPQSDPTPAQEEQAEDGQVREESAQGPGHAVTQDGQIVAFEAVKNLAKDSVLRRVITDPRSGKPLDVGHGVRSAPEQIRTVANHDHTTCAWPQGCDVPISGTQADHIHSHSRGGSTSADNIQPVSLFVAGLGLAGRVVPVLLAGRDPIQP